MLGNVTLHRDGARLPADVKGNVPGLLDVDLQLFGKARCREGDSVTVGCAMDPRIEPGLRVVA